MRNASGFTSFAAFLCLLGALLGPIGEALAQQRRIALVRDAEIEHIIRVYATPIFAAAGLDPDAVSVHLVNDRSLNAFVTNGQRIFMHTGLLMRAETPQQVIGVLAHETGHISGGHIARSEEALRNAYIESLIATVLGAAAIAAGAASGSGRDGADAGAAIILGGQQMAQRGFLAFSRTQESAADQAGLTYLERTGQSGRGLMEFLKILGDQEALLAQRQDPYVRTHPISRERLDALRTRVEASPFANTPSPPEHVEMHARTQAKLVGFLEPLGTTLRRYPLSDTSLPARYARAIAYYRQPDMDRALAEIDGLLAERPKDPFFWELKGQMLFENGRIAESVVAYDESVRLRPRDPVLLYALGQARIATEDPAETQRAVQILEEAVRLDPRQPGAWFQLSIGYGRIGRLGEAHLASAERALLTGRVLDARQQAERAKGRLPPGSPAALRADDIIFIADERLREQRGR
ncbi:MAG: M48 family metallopeptidase [Alphaproteobacteria bacterium]|nr:M48 family metallopeptidase [Alphaproteobacteria bacterium]